MSALLQVDGISRRFGGIRVDVQYPAVEETVLLELEGGQFQLRGLAGADESNVLVRDPHFGDEVVGFRNERHQDSARSGDRADGMRREVLDDARLWRAQLEQLLTV